jgi:hypothetical protein
MTIKTLVINSETLPNKSMNPDGTVKRKGGRKTMKVKRQKEGGGNNEIMESEPAPVLNISKIESSFIPPAINKSATIQQVVKPIIIQPEQPAPVPVNKIQNMIQNISHNNTQSGGEIAKNVRVELRKRHTPKKVLLKPKQATTHQPHTSGHSRSHLLQKTRKSRKITLGLSSLRRRITHAKKIRDKVKSMPIDKLKQQLISKGLIKQGNKTPEALIRQIAADAQIVSGNGL